MKRITLGLTLLLFFLTTSAVAQQLTGRIEGSVMDPTGAVVAGAAVTATHIDTNTTYDATTSRVGGFFIPSVRLGRYNIAVEVPGFRRYVVTDALVEVGSTASITVLLEVGAVTSEVVVTSDIAQSIINTVDAELSTVIDERRVLDLPLNGRNAIELALLQAGVFFERNADGAGAQFNIHGQRNDSLNITLNGIDVNDQISRAISVMLDFPLLPLAAENVQELKVITGIGSAEFSRGGAQITAVNRGGGNQWHGSLFNFHRNDSLSANTFFNNTLGLPIPKLIRNQFGGRVGGPIQRDKMFFFFGYQQTRQSRGIPVQRLVYTPEALQGIFRYRDSDGAIASVNLLECGANVQTILGRDCFDNRFDLSSPEVSGGAVTQDPFISGTIFPLAPPSNDCSFGDGLNTCGVRFNARSGLVEHLPSFRLDYIISPKHAFYGTYNYTDRQITGDFINDREPRFASTGTLGNRVTHARGYSGAVTSTFTPTLVNEARFGWLIGDNRFDVIQPFDTPFLLDFNINHPDSGRWIYDNNNQTESRITNTLHLRDVVNWIRGSHQFKFGGEFRQRSINFNSFDGVNPFGEIDFNEGDNEPGYDRNDLRDMAGASRPSSGIRDDSFDLINDLLGAIGDVERRYNVRDLTSGFDVAAEERRIIRNREIDLFFNDTWQVRPNFTLNLGMRWEYSSVPVETQGLILVPEGGFDAVFGVSGAAGFFNPGVFAGHSCDSSIFPSGLSDLSLTPTRQLVRDMLDGCSTRYIPGSASNGVPLWDDDYNNFGPVVSFAWDPWNNGKTVLRAGFRISYIQDAFAIVERNLDDNEGLVVNQTCEPLEGNCQNNPLLLRDLIGSGTPESPEGGTPIAAVPNFQLPAFRSIRNSSSIDFRTFDNKLKTSYYEEWTLGIQHEILPETVLEVRYVGNRGVSLRNLADYNENNIFSVDPNTDQSFLNSFLRAQANLACNLAVDDDDDFRDQGNSLDPACLALPNAGFLGANPLMDVLIAGDPGRLAGTSGLRNALLRNEPGEFLDDLTIDRTSRPASGQGRERGGSWWGAVLRGDLPANFFKANPFVMSARAMNNTGFSTYHSLEVEFRRRMSQGLLFQTNYTFGKAISDFNGLSTTLFTQKPSPILNPRSTIQEIAPRHQFNSNWVYELPLGQGRGFAPQNAILRKVLEGWQTSGLIKFRSGRPLSIRSTRGSFLPASESDENTVNLSQPLSIGGLRSFTGLQDSGSSVVWFDPCMSVARQAANVTCTDPRAIPGLFTYPNPGEIGQLKQTPIFGPKRFLLDFGLAKHTHVTETVDVEFRWEVFNLTNTPNFDIPENRIRDTDFGKILDTITNSRVMQFALKINF